MLFVERKGREVTKNSPITVRDRNFEDADSSATALLL
jgi:hypothetical protein